MANIDTFKSKLTGGGARANLFRVVCSFPAFAGGADESEKASFLVKAAQLPGSIIAPVTVPFRGRQLQLAGDKTFEPWTITVLNDSDMAIRNAFERWSNGIAENNSARGLTNPIDYMADMVVEQLDRNEEVLKTYTFRSTFPTNVSPIDLSADSENTIEEFTVELQVQYWESDTTS
jgi:hypothetical protein